MKSTGLLIAALMLFSVSADASRRMPTRYTELNQYVVTAPNQGDAVTCLFMASTGAMEILLSKKLRIKNPKQWGLTDISERYLISMRNSSPVAPRYWFEDAFLIFNTGEAILNKDMPFEAYDENGDENLAVWNTPDNFETAPRIKLPKVDTVFLFSVGDRYSKNVLDETHVMKIKEALIEHESPIITIGNDEAYWHATVITGYDDNEEGDCYELDSKVCKGKKGAFYVRDSFGNGLEKRSYEWFIRRQNSAAVAKLAENQ